MSLEELLESGNVPKKGDLTEEELAKRMSLTREEFEKLARDANAT